MVEDGHLAQDNPPPPVCVHQIIAPPPLACQKVVENNSVSILTDATYVDNFVAAVQTYQMELDSDNPLGRLPGCLVRELGDSIAEYVILRDPNNNEFEVHVVRKPDELYFGDGWHGLKDAYDLKFGAWVTLSYIGPELFTVRLLTRWCFEVVYPRHNPPLRHLLARDDPHCKIGSSVLSTCFVGSDRPKSLIRSYVKEVTLYDIHSGTLVLPYCGFGNYAFVFVFSDLILVDNAGGQYKCALKLDLQGDGEMVCRVSGGWGALCATHGVCEGDRVKFSVSPYTATNVMFVSIYPRMRIEDYLKQTAFKD